MKSMRESWTDERLDDLNHKVDAGFDRVDADLRGLRVEMKTEFVALRGETRSGFERIDEHFDRFDDRFERIDDRFDRFDDRFERIDDRFDRFDDRFERFDERFERIDGRFDRFDDRFERINERFDALHRLLVQSAGVLLAALIGLRFI